ncbi:MinD/ParA family ATP-binding protein [Legionella nagasakiensis]|uniref:MinD/ParA family ATP-binding protein n=1 Tax=Legionella nagasakiensis TaxID=535290 RepID=UPI0013EF88D2|nr:AAA family ATPase [Legionella nagasakiensis]
MNKSVRVISIAGGKGGVGKTTLSVNLAVALAKQGKKILLFDADLSLANVDLLLGIRATKTIHDVLAGTHTIRDICLTVAPGLKVIPSASGIQSLADLNPRQTSELIRSFSELDDEVDMMIVDIAAGISNQVIHLTNASQYIVIVLCNEPSSLTDAYAMMKILYQRHGRAQYGVVINKSANEKESQDVFLRFQNAATKFIDINIQYLGYIPHDDYIIFASREKKSVVNHYPHSKATAAFRQLSNTILSWHQDSLTFGGIQYFLERFVQCSEA